MGTETQRIDTASNVRRLRKAQGLTEIGLAEHSGLCLSWISRLERRAENPSIATLQRLASGLRVQVQDLLSTAVGDPTP